MLLGSSWKSRFSAGDQHVKAGNKQDFNLLRFSMTGMCAVVAGNRLSSILAGDLKLVPNVQRERPSGRGRRTDACRLAVLIAEAVPIGLSCQSRG